VQGKSFSEQFRRDAVALYQSSQGATVKAIAADLGVRPDTLSKWIRAEGLTPRPRPRRGPVAPDGVRAGALDPAGPGEELARLRRRVAELEAEQRKLATERDILRQAAKYFAGETNW
jgi:transposase